MPFGVGFYLFGSTVFGDTSGTNKVIVHVFLLSHPRVADYHYSIFNNLKEQTMKKIFCFLLLLSVAFTVNAQSDSRFTFKAGVGMSSIVSEDGDSGTKLSYKVGAYYNLNFTENFYMAPGVEFAYKGGYLTNVEGVLHMCYVQIPVPVAYRFNIGSNTLSLSAGPYIAYGLFGTDIEDFYGTENVFEYLEPFDLGVVAGASYNFNNYIIGLEYSRGVYNQDISINFGYNF